MTPIPCDHPILYTFILILCAVFGALVGSVAARVLKRWGW